MSSTSSHLTSVSFLGQDSEERRLHYRDRPQFSPTFWDKLSKIDLTALALEEHNRRILILHQQRQPHISIPPDSQQRSALISVADYLGHCGTKDLQNMKRSAMHGGPDFSDLREFPSTSDQVMSLRPRPYPIKRRKLSPSAAEASIKPSTEVPTRSSTRSPASTRRTGPYNRNFQQHLIDGGIFPPVYRYPNGQQTKKPDNWDEIKQMLAQPRRSLSPSTFSEEDYNQFVQAEADAVKEKQVTTYVLPIIEGSIIDGKCVSGGVPFNNLNPLTASRLTPANPDIYCGARPEQLDRLARDELQHLIIPTTQDDLPICPNFLVAVKGPEGTFPVAIRQMVYDGTFGARCIDSLKNYRANDAVHENKAYTISCCFHSGCLQIYTIHKQQTNHSDHEYVYVTHKLAGWDMCSDVDTFRNGATAFRNARDWAKQQRDNAIEEVNKRIHELQQPIV